MKRRKILGIVVLLCVVIALGSLLFLPINRTVNTTSGNYLERSGKYLRMSGNIYVNAEKFPDLPELYKGDKLEIVYYLNDVRFTLSGEIYLNDIARINIVYTADWGVLLNLFDISPTGARLSIENASQSPRDLSFTESFTLEFLDKNGWTALSALTDSSFSTEAIPFPNGADLSFDLNWETLYGTLAPGEYRLCKAISSARESRNFYIAFTITKPLPTDLDAAIELTVYDLLCKQLIYPKKLSTSVIEYIPTKGFATDPQPPIGTGRFFDQIAIDYRIVERTQAGNQYIISILGMCRGYLQKRFIDECYTPMRLVLQENADGTFEATSCIIPRKLHLTGDTQQFFSPEVCNQLTDTRLMKQMQRACDAQMQLGGVTHTIFVSQKAFEKDSPEATLIQEAIASSKPRTHTDYGGTVYTFKIEGKTYYFYSEMAMIHDVTFNKYVTFSASYSREILSLFTSQNP
jgi:hypothetical protein